MKASPVSRVNLPGNRSTVGLPLSVPAPGPLEYAFSQQQGRKSNKDRSADPHAVKELGAQAVKREGLTQLARHVAADRLGLTGSWGSGQWCGRRQQQASPRRPAVRRLPLPPVRALVLMCPTVRSLSQAG